MCSKCQQMIEVLSPKHLSNYLNHVHVGCTCLPDFPAVAALSLVIMLALWLFWYFSLVFVALGTTLTF